MRINKKAPYIGYIENYIPLNKVCEGLDHICPNCMNWNNPITGIDCDCENNEKWIPQKPLL